MRKLGSVLYHKLLLQAEEAKDQGLNDLSERILDTIGPEPEDQAHQYAYAQFKEDLNHDMWKLAARVMAFYDLKSVDAVKLDEIITSCADRTLDELENMLGAEQIMKSPLDPKLPGEDK